MQRLKDLISKKYLNNITISQAWLKMYEILSTFNLISKKIKKLILFIYVNYQILLLVLLIIILRLKLK